MTNTNPSTDLEDKITNNSEAVKIERFLELHMRNILFPVPPIRTATTESKASSYLLPAPVCVVKEMDKNEVNSLARLVLFI